MRSWFDPFALVGLGWLLMIVPACHGSPAPSVAPGVAATQASQQGELAADTGLPSCEVDVQATTHTNLSYRALRVLHTEWRNGGATSPSLLLLSDDEHIAAHGMTAWVQPIPGMSRCQGPGLRFYVTVG